MGIEAYSPRYFIVSLGGGICHAVMLETEQKRRIFLYQALYHTPLTGRVAETD